MMEQTDLVWHIFIPKLPTGWRYGYRAHGDWNPEAGQRYNPNKLLLDPYVKAVDGEIDWGKSLFPYPMKGDAKQRHLRLDEHDSGPYMPKGVVIDQSFDWEGDLPLDRPMHDTIIYEAHVKGFTQLMPDVPNAERGTYAALRHPAVIEYLKNLGVTGRRADAGAPLHPG